MQGLMLIHITKKGPLVVDFICRQIAEWNKFPLHKNKKTRDNRMEI